MATPRSVLRPIPATFPTTLSVSLSLPRQLFSYALGTSSKVATPATNKRKVAFNDEVYIQEIVDIRDKRMHWDARVDEEEVKKAARIPLPVSPAPVRMVCLVFFWLSSRVVGKGDIDCFMLLLV